MSPKNYFFLLFTFYFGFFTKSKIKIKGKRQCGKFKHLKYSKNVKEGPNNFESILTGAILDVSQGRS